MPFRSAASWVAQHPLLSGMQSATGVSKKLDTHCRALDLGVEWNAICHFTRLLATYCRAEGNLLFRSTGVSSKLDTHCWAKGNLPFRSTRGLRRLDTHCWAEGNLSFRWTEMSSNVERNAICYFSRLLDTYCRVKGNLPFHSTARHLLSSDRPPTISLD